MFGVLQSNATIKNTTTQLNRKCKIQDGGHKTGSNVIQACRQYCNIISTSAAMFQVSSFEKGLTRILNSLAGYVKS